LFIRQDVVQNFRHARQYSGKCSEQRSGPYRQIINSHQNVDYSDRAVSYTVTSIVMLVQCPGSRDDWSSGVAASSVFAAQALGVTMNNIVAIRTR
jgi:hypothetical protein